MIVGKIALEVRVPHARAHVVRAFELVVKKAKRGRVSAVRVGPLAEAHVRNVGGKGGVIGPGELGQADDWPVARHQSSAISGRSVTCLSWRRISNSIWRGSTNVSSGSAPGRRTQSYSCSDVSPTVTATSPPA